MLVPADNVENTKDSCRTYPFHRWGAVWPYGKNTRNPAKSGLKKDSRVYLCCKTSVTHWTRGCLLEVQLSFNQLGAELSFSWSGTKLELTNPSPTACKSNLLQDELQISRDAVSPVPPCAENFPTRQPSSTHENLSFAWFCLVLGLFLIPEAWVTYECSSCVQCIDPALYVRVFTKFGFGGAQKSWLEISLAFPFRMAYETLYMRYMWQMMVDAAVCDGLNLVAWWLSGTLS